MEFDSKWACSGELILPSFGWRTKYLLYLGTRCWCLKLRVFFFFLSSLFVTSLRECKSTLHLFLYVLDIFGITEVLFGLFLVWSAFRLLFFGLICIWVNGDIPCCLFNNFFLLKKKTESLFPPFFWPFFLELSVWGIERIISHLCCCCQGGECHKSSSRVSRSKRNEEYEKVL